MRRDVIVRCESLEHRVRLEVGLRFFARARCPTCGAAVDPHRWRRLLRFTRNLRRPASDGVLDRATWVAAMGLTAGALMLALVFRTTADVWWPTTVLLFGPRWTSLLLLPPVLVLAAVRDRALLVPLGLAVGVLVGAVVGFNLGVSGALHPSRPADVTVVTLNSGRLDASELALGVRELAREWAADVVMIQECRASIAAEFASAEGWHSARVPGLCAASRFPVVDVSSMDREALASVGGSGRVTTFTIGWHRGAIRVTNVHLETPRAGFEQILAGEIRTGIATLREKSVLREIELRRAERWAREAGPPGIVVGDFNTPPESRHFRRIWGHWTDAFATAGFGLGGTRDAGWTKPRIDYVLADDHWTVVSARVGDAVGSDHLPVIARLRLKD